MENCNICPRNCNVNRNTTNGYCGVCEDLIVKYVMLHHFEEPIISGDENGVGSGAIFFGGCSLRCEYCQNFKLSHEYSGYKITTNQLAKIFKKLEQLGAYNINLVTPTHFTDKILDTLKIYKPNIPIVWNTSGYEKPETIEKLKGYVDIFLTDLKYITPNSALLSSAPNYFEYASKSIIKMKEIVGDDVMENGLMKKGLIVRHLVLPNYSSESVDILQWIADNLGENTIVSVMNQYVPMFKAKNNPLINRKVKKIEYKRVIAKALSLKLNNAYFQDEDSASEDYTPNFNDNKNLLFNFGIISPQNKG